MIDYNNCRIASISVHHIGNKSAEETLQLSKESLLIEDEHLHKLLLHFFLSSFNAPEFFSFTTASGDVRENTVYATAFSLFEEETAFHEQSVHLAKHLYATALHPNAKCGDLYLVYFANIRLQGNLMDAIGLFKSETKDSFLKLQATTGKYVLNYEEGIHLDKLDKGCVIFNTCQETGYKVSLHDRSRVSEGQYWKNDFLGLKPVADAYQHTKNYLNLTKNFVTGRLNEEFEVSKADQIDLLNRSMEYFKKHEQFEEKHFAKALFDNKEVIDSFTKFKHDFREEQDLDIVEDFAISSPAVKKQSRVFKSVLKLDKNFHIYIHGNREMIEKGTDTDGRKYYKIYYNEET